MSFKRKDCIIRKIYCGEDKKVGEEYSRRGSQYECLKKGFGIADWKHRKKDLAPNSLQQIMYIGPVYEKKFKNSKINSIPDLLNQMKKLTKSEKEKLLEKCCNKNQKVMNSVILFLHDQGVGRLPNCIVYEE